jgi:hypothetical protein
LILTVQSIKILTVQSIKNQGVSQRHCIREYIPQYTIPRKVVIYCITVYTPLYAGHSWCTKLSRCTEF